MGNIQKFQVLYWILSKIELYLELKSYNLKILPLSSNIFQFEEIKSGQFERRMNNFEFLSYKVKFLN